MFPTQLVEVLFIFGMIFISFIFQRGLLYIVTGFMLVFLNLRDTTNTSETILMFILAVVIMYYGATVKDKK